MPNFPLQDRSADWAAQAPVVINRSFAVKAAPDAVFDVMADLVGWSSWFKGMRKVQIDGDLSSGVGARRTVWVGATRAEERFLVWEPGQRMSFVLTAANLPGLAAMVEDYSLTPGADGGTVVTATIGVEGRLLLRPLHGLLKVGIGASTKGITGLAELFG
jgi:hypothetical protein